MKTSLIALALATGLIASVPTPAESRGGASYAQQYCYYYKQRALGTKSRARKDQLWAQYRACLREYG